MQGQGLQDVKSVVRKNIPEGLRDGGLTLRGKTEPLTYRKFRCTSREFDPKSLIHSLGVGLYNEHQLLKNGKKEKNQYLLLFAA